MTEEADQEFIPTVTARPSIAASAGHRLAQASELQPADNLGSNRFVTVAQAVTFIEDAMRQVLAIRPHPTDSMSFHVDVETLRALKIVCGRVSPRQHDMLKPESDTDAALSDIHDCESQMRPLIELARDARAKGISAERFVSTINATPNSRLATRRYMAIEPTAAVITSENMVFTPVAATPLPKTYEAAQTYSISVKIDSTNHTRQEIKVALLGYEEGCPLFRSADLYSRTITIQVLRDSDATLLLQAKLCDAPLTLRVALQVKVSGAGMEYFGTLDGIVEPALIRRRFAEYSRLQQQELDLG